MRGITTFQNGGGQKMFVFMAHGVILIKEHKIVREITRKKKVLFCHIKGRFADPLAISPQ